MKLEIHHTTTYTYSAPVVYALQRLRLRPRDWKGQTVVEWTSHITGGTHELSYEDPFLNKTDLVRLTPDATNIEITSHGIVETEDYNGIVGAHRGLTPLWLYKQPTRLTAAGNRIRQLAAQFRSTQEHVDEIAWLHDIAAAIKEAVLYSKGETTAETTAEIALSAGQGVCQDHAHIMIAVARNLGYPARYVSGYLLIEGQTLQEASHAWCEVWTENLGWVGFDVSNGISPDTRYARVALGRDYMDAAPILGIRLGTATEALSVSLQVQQ